MAADDWKHRTGTGPRPGRPTAKQGKRLSRVAAAVVPLLIAGGMAVGLPFWIRGEPAPLFLMAETSSNPEWKALVPAPLPTDIPNRHLEYALTWYGLAGALLGVYAAMLLRSRKR